MNCQEVRTLAPLYLSGELTGSGRELFAGHLSGCPECSREIEAQLDLDAQLAGAFSGSDADCQRVEERFRAQLARERAGRRWWYGAAIAASLLIGVTAGAIWLEPAAPTPPWFSDAARDHRVEVMEKQPRRWRSTDDELEALAAMHGLSHAQISALAPAGYRLERAKNCGINGQRSLHLVFGNGEREYSLYLSKHETATPLRVVRSNAESVAGFETGRYRAAVVTAGPQTECESIARFAASLL